MRILSVDDDSQNLYLIEAVVQAHGHQVVSAHNGVEALEELEKGPFDLVVSDILMPEMDGFQLCREMKTREEFRDIPFIFYTATYTAKRDEEFGLALGASRFIIKPVEPDQFMAIVREVLNEHQRRPATLPEVKLEERAEYLEIYNERLARKLERKIEQLGITEEQLRLVWECSREGMVLVDGEGKIVQANQAFAGIFGKSVAELEGKPATVCFAEEGNEVRVRDFREQVATRNLETDFERQMTRWDGKRIWLQVSKSFIETARGPLVVGIVRDVTEQRRVEQERANLELQFRQAQKMESIGRLAGGIAHDFNNLLTVINGYSDLLLNRLPQEDPVRAQVSEIRQAGERAAGLTRQLLTFSRRQIVELKRLDFNRIVRETHGLIQRLVGDDVEVVTELAGEAAWVLADQGQLEQVLMNLVVNARDAMPEGGRVTIRTAAGEKPEAPGGVEVAAGPYLLLSVSDTGLGMDAETRQHVFEPFFTTKAEGKGTGLGLSTVYGIVRQCGGWIEVESEPGQGATFRLWFPLADGGGESGQ